MPVRFNFQKLQGRREIALVIVDLLMLLLVLINFAWIIFDWHFSIGFIKDAWKAVAPEFYYWYDTKIHPYFLLFDAIFVSIFITEIIIRWIIAARRKTYHRWFFYPFVHWYDVLGCIPMGSFRFLRFLRIITLTTRLQKIGVVDITGTYLYRTFNKYYNIVVEEVSDRVVLNVLDGMQDEIREGNPIMDRILVEVVRPYKEPLVEWISHRVKKATEHNYTMYRKDIEEYVNMRIVEAVKKNKEIKDIRRIPVVGGQISRALEQSISDITFSVVNGMVEDLASDRNNKAIEEVTDMAFDIVLIKEEDEELNRIAENIAIQSLELIKEQVRVQKWKVEAEKEEEIRKRARSIKKAQQSGSTGNN